jgi:hypothetical protein
MVRLTTEQYDKAVAKMVWALRQAEDAGMRTDNGRMMVVLEALGNDFDIEVMEGADDPDYVRPLATDEADEFIVDLNDRLTEQRANGLLDWSQGRRP